MIAYLIRRLPSVAFLLLATTVVAFALPRLAPGDPAAAVAGSDASPETLAQIREQMGLDQPILTQYLDWMGGVLTGDLGTSFTTNRPVSELIGLRTTFLIAGIVPGIEASIAIVWARMPADEIAHPLRDEPEQEPERADVPVRS